MKTARRFWAWVQRFPLTFAILAIAVALVVVATCFVVYVRSTGEQHARDQEQHTQDQAALARTDAVSECRSKIAARVSSAQVDNDLAIDQLVKAIGRDVHGPFTDEITHLDQTGAVLDAARNDRNAFEAHPTGDCP